MDTRPVAVAGRRSEKPSGRVLIVEYDGGLPSVVAQRFRDGGYIVSCADGGKEGWGALRSLDFDLLITDFDTLSLDGLDLLRHVRAHMPKLPVIVLSGSELTDEPDIGPLLHLGKTLAKRFPVTALITGF